PRRAGSRAPAGAPRPRPASAPPAFRPRGPPPAPGARPCPHARAAPFRAPGPRAPNRIPKGSDGGSITAEKNGQNTPIFYLSIQDRNGLDRLITGNPLHRTCRTWRRRMAHGEPRPGPNAPPADEERPRQRRPARLPDPTDEVIISALAEDARTGITEIAALANVSRATAYNRIKRLTDDGIIQGYSVIADHARMGLGVTALILISGSQPDWRANREVLSSYPEVEYCWYVV